MGNHPNRITLTPIARIHTLRGQGFCVALTRNALNKTLWLDSSRLPLARIANKAA
jgi:hypothetical protein